MACGAAVKIQITKSQSLWDCRKDPNHKIAELGWIAIKIQNNKITELVWIAVNIQNNKITELAVKIQEQ